MSLGIPPTGGLNIKTPFPPSHLWPLSLTTVPQGPQRRQWSWRGQTQRRIVRVRMSAPLGRVATGGHLTFNLSSTVKRRTSWLHLRAVVGWNAIIHINIAAHIGELGSILSPLHIALSETTTRGKCYFFHLADEEKEAQRRRQVSELNFVSPVCLLNHSSHLEHQLEYNTLSLGVN